MAPTLVLVHSPLTGPAAWGRLAEALAATGIGAVTVDVTDDDRAPYAARFLARAALQVRESGVEGPLTYVGHSGAGPLLPQLAAARRAARLPVAGYVFLDAGLPRAGATRLDLMRSEDAAFAEELHDRLHEGARFPEWGEEELREEIPDAGLRAAVVASLRPRGHAYFTEPLPCPPDWPDAPCAYLRTSASYAAPARAARARGWPVVERDVGHFAACADPEGVAADLAALLGVR